MTTALSKERLHNLNAYSPEEIHSLGCDRPPSTRQKALTLNLDQATYGTGTVPKPSGF